MYHKTKYVSVQIGFYKNEITVGCIFRGTGGCLGGSAVGQISFWLNILDY